MTRCITIGQNLEWLASKHIFGTKQMTKDLLECFISHSRDPNICVQAFKKYISHKMSPVRSIVKHTHTTAMPSLLQVPESTCSAACGIGQVRRVKGFHSCCFDCIDCLPGTYQANKGNIFASQIILWNDEAKIQLNSFPRHESKMEQNLLLFMFFRRPGWILWHINCNT